MTGSGAHDKRVTALLWSGPTGVRATFSAESREDPVLSCLSCLERRVMALDDERVGADLRAATLAVAHGVCAGMREAHLGEQPVPPGHRVRTLAPPPFPGPARAARSMRRPSWASSVPMAMRVRDASGKEAARQSATDAGPQAFYDELALARLKRWGGTSSGNQANPRRQIANPSSFDNGVTEPPSRGHLEISIATDSRTFARSP